jgi:hypothetical protein
MEVDLRSFRNQLRRRLAPIVAVFHKMTARFAPRAEDFQSQRMCPFCGLVTSRSKRMCLQCGKTFGAA